VDLDFYLLISDNWFQNTWWFSYDYWFC